MHASTDIIEDDGGTGSRISFGESLASLYVGDARDSIFYLNLDRMSNAQTEMQDQRCPCVQ